MGVLLETRNLSRHFGGLRAVDRVTLQVYEGEILGLIGPNGAGKTTVFNVISGFLKPTAGEVHFRGRPIHGHRPNAIARQGIGRTFQIVKPFADLTVRANVLAGMGAHMYPTLSAFTHLHANPDAVARADAILARVGLHPYAEVGANTLPIGLQRRLEIARALALGPILLLLDESAAGLTHEEAAELARLVRDLRQEGMTVLLVEHNMRFAMNLCDRIVVLNQGRVLAEGTPTEIQHNPAVIEAYLGHSGLVAAPPVWNHAGGEP